MNDLATDVLRLAKDSYQQGRVDALEAIIEGFRDHAAELGFTPGEAARVIAVVNVSLDIVKAKPA